MLREAEALLSQGQSTGEVCRRFGVSEQNHYRWREEYGGLKVDPARRLKELEKESARRPIGFPRTSPTRIRTARFFVSASMRRLSGDRAAQPSAPAWLGGTQALAVEIVPGQRQHVAEPLPGVAAELDDDCP